MDYSTGFADADGKLAAQGLTLPGASRLGADRDGSRSCATSRDDMAPGDVFIMNDPFDGGMHLPDIFIFKPLYHEGERLAFACTVCHHTDVGGRVAGLERVGLDRDLRRGPAHRADEALRGAASSTRRIMTFIEKNVRLPVQVFGDLRAQLAACHIAEKQFAELVARYGPEQTKFYLQRDHRLRRAPDARRAARAARRRMELRGLDRRRRRRLRQADPAVRHHPQDRRPHGGRLDRHQPAGQGRDQQHALLHQGGGLHRRALGAAAGHPEQRGRVPRHRGDLPARHGRQRRAAGGLRGARPHRLPHGRLHVRRARHDAARQGQGGRRRRQHRHLDRRLRRGAQAVHLCRLHLRRLGRAALGRRARRQLAHVRQHGLALDRGDRGRAADPAPGLRVRARQGGRGQIPRRRAVPARLPVPGGRRRAAGALRPPRPPPVRPLRRQPGRAVGELPQSRHREPRCCPRSSR